jgi:hypothetical protein
MNFNWSPDVKPKCTCSETTNVGRLNTLPKEADWRLQAYLLAARLDEKEKEVGDFFHEVGKITKEAINDLDRTS